MESTARTAAPSLETPSGPKNSTATIGSSAAAVEVVSELEPTIGSIDAAPDKVADEEPCSPTTPTTPVEGPAT